MLRLYLPFLQLPLKQKMGVFHYVRPWMFGFILAGIPVATYTWMIYTRPDVYSQVGMLLGPGAVCTVLTATCCMDSWCMSAWPLARLSLASKSLCLGGTFSCSPSCEPSYMRE